MREWNDFDNLMVKTGAVVLSITMDGKRRAKGARYWDRETDTETEVEAGRVVIAGGVIESAKLLQRSTSGDWTGEWEMTTIRWGGISSLTPT